MTPKAFYKHYPRDHVESVAVAAGTTLANFQQIVYGGSVSRDLAKRLADASGGDMTREEILYPEEFETGTDAA